MTIAGDRLAQVQLDGHRAIDGAYRELSREVAAAVLRRATPDANGILRLSLPSRAAILTDLGRLIDAARTDLLIAILVAIKAAEDAAMVGAEPLPRDIGAALIASGETWRTLGTDRSSVISQTGALLARGIAAGQPARAVAKVCREYFSPFFSPRRDENGRVLRADRHGAVTRWPGRSGMASAHARLVLLDQTSKAHSRTQRRIARRDDQLLRFHVSHQHLETDHCDRLERQDVGFGSGLYPPDAAPAVPVHIRCRCWYERADRPRFLTQSESVPA